MSKAYEQSEESKSGPVVRSDNQNVIGHTVMFYEPMEMFERIPFNGSLKEKSWVHSKANEGEMSIYYTFFKKMQGGGLIKLLDTYVSADISVRKSDGNKLSDTIICDYLPRPLTSWWKSVDVAANGVSLSVSNIFSRLFERKNSREDLYGCNMGWEDVPDKMKYLQCYS